MEVNTCVKDSFSVIGKEGSTLDGEGFIQGLWQNADSHFNEIVHLAKKDEAGTILGIWGAMSDLSRSFRPWEDGFSKGLYLAGVEVVDDALPPEGWTKWTIPSYEYLYVINGTPSIFQDTIRYIDAQGISLVGAVHEFTCPETKTPYLFFPIRRL